MKRFVIVVVFFQVLALVTQATINLTYILKRERRLLQPNCIAEELERYKAIGWVYPIPDNEQKLSRATTKFMPNIQNDYNCKFSKQDKCNLRWSVRDWHIDDSSSKTREFLADNRWEDLPTILLSNDTKDFENRFHIETAQKTGFSVRSLFSVEVFICTGWNPRNYPCYYFLMEKNDIYLSKFHSFDEGVDYKNSKLEYYHAFSNILSDDEWKNFEVNIEKEGKIVLTDKDLNRTVLAHVDKEPLTPMYLLIRSQKPSVWKVSENQFMYTKSTQISRMGPQLHISYKDLCVSLFVATCSNCEMTFFYMNGTNKNILKYVGPTNEDWIEIKLKQENIQLSKFNIFVETQFSGATEEKAEGWWAYDDVRICHENEVKVSYLTLNEVFREDDDTVDRISCQLISKPSWRPTKLEYDEIKGFPIVTAMRNDTAIKLTWKQEDPDNYINYFMFYQGTDDCESDISNSIRLRSAGFLSNKHNEIIINNLIPKTKYNITMSTVLHRIDKFLMIETLEAEELSLEELPIKIHIRPTDTDVKVSWDQPSCNAQRGRLIYDLEVSSPKYNINKTLTHWTDNMYVFTGLRPYTIHTFKIWTARNARMLNIQDDTFMLQYNFTTLPGVAPSIENLEVYAIGLYSAYLRYDLPTNAGGIPTEVQVTRCNLHSSAKCRSTISKIQRCILWKNKYCVNVDYLLPEYGYKFRVSVKNYNTDSFGDTSEKTDYATEKVPAPPENVTYAIVECEANIDYCHLNISWSHPYFPNGTIDTFYIILTDADANSVTKPIQEVYKILNNTYLPKYTYQVKYVPYDTKYNLTIQSANSKFKSDFTTSEVQTEDIAKYLNQKPNLLTVDEKSLVFKLPSLDRRLDGYKATVIVQDFNNSVPVQLNNADNRLVRKLCHPFGLTWISQEVEVVTNETNNVTINSLDEKNSLNPNTQYCITFLIKNKYRGKEYEVVYYEKLTTPEAAIIAPPSSPPETASTSPYNHLYILLVILLLIPIGFLLYRFIRKKKNLNKERQEQNAKENVYECLPFEEHDGNFVNNRTYDQLIHK